MSSSFAQIAFDGPTEFGLFPTTPPSKSSTPACSSLPSAKKLKSVDCVKVYSPKAAKNGIYISQDWFYDEYVLRVLRRNPALVGLAEFLEFCRPRGGILSPNGLTCQYAIYF